MFLSILFNIIHSKKQQKLDINLNLKKRIAFDGIFIDLDHAILMNINFRTFIFSWISMFTDKSFINSSI